ncbi:hypothetical protein ACLOJK_029784 [Asimina triloba]
MGEAAFGDDDTTGDGLLSTQICPPCLVANLFDDSNQPSKTSLAIGSVTVMSKTMAHCLDDNDVVGDARRWGNRAPLVAAVVLPGTDRPIGGSLGSHQTAAMPSCP